MIHRVDLVRILLAVLEAPEKSVPLEERVEVLELAINCLRVDIDRQNERSRQRARRRA